MKYIKLYETHNNYYQEIESDEYDVLTLGHCDDNLYNTMDGLNFISKNWADFTPSEISQIMAYFPVGYTYTISIEGMLEIQQHGRFKMGIVKLKDEWYFLTGEKEDIGISEVDFYKCDQFEGLKKLLNDKFLGVNESRKRTAIYIDREIEREKIQDLSEYLQEIFDKYHIPESNQYDANAWSLKIDELLGKSSIEIRIDADKFKSILADLDDIKPLLERRLSSKVDIRVYRSPNNLINFPSNGIISIYVLKGDDQWRRFHKPLKKAKRSKQQNTFKRR